jgi:hypothetical protein
MSFFPWKTVENGAHLWKGLFRTERCEESLPVSRILFPWSFIWDLRCRRPRAVYPGTSPPAPKDGRGERAAPVPCLTLHRVGFAVPSVSPRKRWALTPPFHPCLPVRRRARRFFFCGTFHRSPGVRVTDHPALRSPDFPPAAGVREPRRRRPCGKLSSRRMIVHPNGGEVNR